MRQTRSALLLTILLGIACADPTRPRIRMVEAEFILPAELPSGVGQIVVLPSVRYPNELNGITDSERFGEHFFPVTHTSGEDTPVRVRVPLRFQPGWDVNLYVLTCLDDVSQGSVSVWPTTEQLLDGSLSMRLMVGASATSCADWGSSR
jgi:hypothetical protein